MIVTIDETNPEKKLFINNEVVIEGRDIDQVIEGFLKALNVMGLFYRIEYVR